MPGSELIGELEQQAVNDVFSSGGVLFAHGGDKIRQRYFVREFEAKIVETFSSTYTQCVSSGSAALYCALKALKIGPGDEVITQSHNFIATVEAIVLAGATPIIAGIDDTLNLCPLSFKNLISSRTKAVIPVHMLGVPCRMDKIWSIASEYKIPVVEDCCEAVGAKFDDEHVGTKSLMGVHSYDFGKNITTGEGGSVYTNDNSIYELLRAIHDHGHAYKRPTDRGNDPIRCPGFNFRMTEISGSIGLAQISRLDFIISENTNRYQVILEAFAKEGLEDIVRDIPAGSTPSFDTFIFKVTDEAKRKEVVKLLNTVTGCKNLPGAINWHCSFYWDHIINTDNNKSASDTLALLRQHIAIPISLKISIETYSQLSSRIVSFLK